MWRDREAVLQKGWLANSQKEKKTLHQVPHQISITPPTMNKQTIFIQISKNTYMCTQISASSDAAITHRNPISQNHITFNIHIWASFKAFLAFSCTKIGFGTFYECYYINNNLFFILWKLKSLILMRKTAVKEMVTGGRLFLKTLIFPYL